MMKAHEAAHCFSSGAEAGVRTISGGLFLDLIADVQQASPHGHVTVRCVVRHLTLACCGTTASSQLSLSGMLCNSAHSVISSKHFHIAGAKQE